MENLVKYHQGLCLSFVCSFLFFALIFIYYCFFVSFPYFYAFAFDINQNHHVPKSSYGCCKASKMLAAGQDSLQKIQYILRFHLIHFC